ncbi:G5 and 3D domain-containing protein [Planococcus shixiaomingii]|uniref:G5 and 3D domain-containing protein n=1 Tax=Planococcus shixiaomingii TaxID=3058393 RepID=UPI00260EBB4C|nr:G5 and 3D domain-containing protein [Planococcus sp. N022]WKA54861.1 ubiquitin-like domain-containing protein [Planococcus sp. N022]
MSKEANNSKSAKSFKGKSLALAIATVLMFAAVLTFAIYEGTKNTITMTANGKTEEVKTHAKTVGEFLEEQEITVAKDDYLSQSASAPIEGDGKVEWDQAEQYTVTVDGKAKTAWTTKNTVADILDKAEIEVTKHDKVSPALEEQVDEDTAISVEKAFEVTILDGLEQKKAWSTSTTVADFLKQQNISLSELDRVETGMDEVVLPNSEVKVVRVEKVTDVVEDSVKFAAETKKDSSLLKGEEKIVQKGQKGIVKKTYEVVKENGKEVKRDLKKEKVVKEPKKQVTAVGTKVMVASVSRGKDTTPAAKQETAKAKTVKASAPVKKEAKAEKTSEPAGKEMIVSATAYTASCAGCSGITATGINLKSNPGIKLIAVDPSVIPLGSKVWVEGYGYAIAGDTGGAIKGNKIDLFIADQSAALSFGRKQVKIKVLN